MKNYIIIFFCFFSLNSIAQIRCVDYQLKFNNETNQYDIKLIILAGSTSSVMHRAQFNSQISIVVPTGLKVELTDFNMPLQNNQNFASSIAAKWALTNAIIAPHASPLNDFHSVYSVLSPSSFYDELNIGDEVHLFSFTVGEEGTYNENVRFFNNETDLNSLDPGMGGANFSSTFNIGNSGNIYNIASKEGCLILSTEEKLGLDVEVFPNPFQNSITVEFLKDVKSIHVINVNGIVYNSISSNLRDNVVIPTHQFPRGIYIVRIENSNGQVTNKKIVKL